MDRLEQLKQAAQYIREQISGDLPDTGIILGADWEPTPTLWRIPLRFHIEIPRLLSLLQPRIIKEFFLQDAKAVIPSW